MKLSYTLVAALGAIEQVAAHGYLKSFIADGVTYPGWAPYSDVYATVTAGSTVTFQWDQWGSSHSGPVIDYIAKCPNNDCSNFKGNSGTVWVKLQQSGWDKTKSPAWGSDQLAANGAKWTLKVPDLAPGKYILRHEIIGLHVAGTAYGAQCYPHCVQIDLKGSGSKSLPAGVALPGAYKATDPGLLTQLWWFSPSNTTASYTPPGGPVKSI
ncbi:hypothetical protein FRC02_002572 [Tulasnella sp. 418]|nr:hypothetical protein FRC02_002572 [Tulasnella sp. 418]